jgi:hypothetical protein
VRDNKTAAPAKSGPAINAPKIPGANLSQLAQAIAKINAAAAMRQMLPDGGKSDRKPKDPDATDYHAIVPINE